MLRMVANIFKSPDLRNKILFAIALLCIYRIGFHRPIPGFDPAKLKQFQQERRADGIQLRRHDENRRLNDRD